MPALGNELVLLEASLIVTIGRELGVGEESILNSLDAFSHHEALAIVALACKKEAQKGGVFKSSV